MTVGVSISRPDKHTLDTVTARILGNYFPDLELEWLTPEIYHQCVFHATKLSEKDYYWQNVKEAKLKIEKVLSFVLLDKSDYGPGASLLACIPAHQKETAESACEIARRVITEGLTWDTTEMRKSRKGKRHQLESRTPQRTTRSPALVLI